MDGAEEKTIEARLAFVMNDDSLARTIERAPLQTMEPPRTVSESARTAVLALRAVAGDVGARIVLGETLGEGGMGIVHLGTQAALGRHVAVKTLRVADGEAADDERATLRILREAWVTGALEHPNVVPIYDVGLAANGSPVIVMKRIEGQTWSALMHDKETLAERFAAEDALEWNLRILVSVCNAMSFAHSRGILHRDLKPENVMIGAFGEVYVLDWGLALSMREDPSGRLQHVSTATEVAGTPAYMAPEMLAAEHASISERTDVYLLGGIFYEIFAAQPPHVGNLQATIASIVLSEPRFERGFPAEAARICAKAMHRDPRERHASVQELRVAIEDYLRHRGSRKLAHDAKQSLQKLLHTLEHEGPGEERTLAVFNLLGECRFGYKAALSAWPENRSARQGLDRALLAVVKHELESGDPAAASALLREVETKAPELIAQVEAAVKKRAEEDERLRRLDVDLDPQVGSRTRTALGAGFGLVWSAVPLLGMLHVARGGEATHVGTIAMSAAFLLLGFGARWWARETLTKTLLNRRLTATLGIHLCGQIVLGTGAMLAGFTPQQSQLLHIFSWFATIVLLAVWVERWFAVPAALDAIGFLVVSRWPSALYPVMSITNVVFTLVLVRVWFPRQDMERMNERRLELRRRVRRLFLEARSDGLLFHDDE